MCVGNTIIRLSGCDIALGISVNFIYVKYIQCLSTNCIELVKDDQTEENTFEILQHSDININNTS